MEYYSCITHTDEKKKSTTWCGKPKVGYCFVSIDHAVYASLSENRVLVCPECTKAVIAALKEK